MVPWSSTKDKYHLDSTGKLESPVTIQSGSMSLEGPSLNGPDSPPVLYRAPDDHYHHHHEDDEEEDERCRACHANAMYTDWCQGDKVCTNCGVVAEGHLRDTRPEWKDFNDAEDLVKGMPSGARSGLVAVDESKYLGGLQPTTLSKQAYGGDGQGGYGLARVRKRLKATNKRLDKMMEQIHTHALKEAKLDRRIRLKRSRDQPHQHHDDNYDGDDSIRPEMDHLVLQEEEDAHRLQQALYAEKWSLDRAILLYGKPHEQREVSDEEREDLLEKLDSTLRKASKDIYTAYSILTQAANTLQLPERVKSEAAHRLLRFVTRKDGIRIPGVASRLSSHQGSGTTTGSASLLERKEIAQQLKEYNARKQMAALGAALLFVTARSLGWTRSIAEICSSFQSKDIHSDDDNSNNNNHNNNNNKLERKGSQYLKPKHVTRAMKEIHALFPEYTQPAPPHVAGVDASSIQNTNVTAGFADHSLRKLQLPSVAEASIRMLLIQLREEQLQSGRLSGTKLPTLGAAITFLVCSAGSVMQRLAQQHRESLQRKPFANTKPTLPPPSKRQKCAPKHEDGASSSDEDDKVLRPSTNSNNNNNEDDDDDRPFDVFSHAPIVVDPTEKQEYELKRMWDAWAEQMSWARSIMELEQSFGVSRTVIHDFYKTELYPRRKDLLHLLSDAVQQSSADGTRTRNFHSLQEAPMASLLLAHVHTAAAVMTVNGR